MNKQERAKEMFEIVGRDPGSWLLSAKTLKVSADLILAEVTKTIETYHPLGRAPGEKQFQILSYMLLAGLALENLVKGILIARNPELITEHLDTTLGRHNLVGLAQRVGGKLSKEETRLLTQLSQYVLWGGRYPIAKNYQASSERNFSTQDPVKIDSLFERFSSILSTVDRS